MMSSEVTVNARYKSLISDCLLRKELECKLKRIIQGTTDDTVKHEAAKELDHVRSTRINYIRPLLRSANLYMAWSKGLKRSDVERDPAKVSDYELHRMIRRAIVFGKYDLAPYNIYMASTFSTAANISCNEKHIDGYISDMVEWYNNT